MNLLTRLPNISSDQITPLVAELLGTIQLQMEEIQFLKDEIARLKGQKPKLKIKPSNLEKKTKKKKASKKSQSLVKNPRPKTLKSTKLFVLNLKICLQASNSKIIKTISYKTFSLQTETDDTEGRDGKFHQEILSSPICMKISMDVLVPPLFHLSYTSITVVA